MTGQGQGLRNTATHMIQFLRKLPGPPPPQTWRHAYSWVFEHLLHGKVFHVDGPPPAPDEDLPKRIQSMGGILQDTLDASCTHVVTHSRGTPPACRGGVRLGGDGGAAVLVQVEVILRLGPQQDVP